MSQSVGKIGRGEGLKAEILSLFQISPFCYPSSMESLLNRNSEQNLK